jgi:protein-S-isoprenylcysteine O-methyltransferase Ste14
MQVIPYFPQLPLSRQFSFSNNNLPGDLYNYVREGDAMLMKNFKRTVSVILAISGILIDKITLLRFILLLIIFECFLLNILFLDYVSFLFAFIFFSIVFIIRYIFLFCSFINKGIADRLKWRFGEEHGFEIYKVITACMFFFSGTGFGLLVSKSSGILFPDLSNSLLQPIGILLIAIGMGTNIWSTFVVGIDIYYYKDLFLQRKISKFKRKGPYNIVSNPMYSLGQVNGYGAAILCASLPGVIFIFLNQLMMYIFYFTIEKPHIKRVFDEKRAYNALILVQKEGTSVN